MDHISIKNLELFANHGLFEEETRLGQKFIISANLYLDLQKAGKTDQMTDSIHYGEVCRFITDYLQENTFGLLEAAAEHLAEALLLSEPLLKRVKIEMKKPWAPIGLPLETVSVTISRGWHTVFLSVGSNMGDSVQIIQEAAESLARGNGLSMEGKIRNLQLSDLIRTKAYGKTDQPDFVNGAIRLETLLSPYALLKYLHKIEAGAGRVRKERWGPRTLDLDILFYDDLILEETDLMIPHIDLANRMFVLEPLMQLCPGKRHPVYGKRVADLYRALQEQDGGPASRPIP